jgi:hypothetical protein
VLQQVLKTAMMPVINMLAVAGLVMIPGMMTGQILAGGDAVTAAKYQILILFAIAASSTSSCILAISSSMLTLTDPHHRLRLDRLTQRRESPLSRSWCVVDIVFSCLVSLSSAMRSVNVQPACGCARQACNPSLSVDTELRAVLVFNCITRLTTGWFHVVGSQVLMHMTRLLHMAALLCGPQPQVVTYCAAQ